MMPESFLSQMNAQLAVSERPQHLWRAVIAGVCLLIVQGNPATAQTPRPDPWGNHEIGYEVGFERADLVLAQCLERAESTPNMRADDCVRTVFLACESEHGNMSQRDLNECAHYSRRAWEKRLETVRSQLLGAKTIDPKWQAEPMVERLRESERRWREWNDADCELQSAQSRGGTMHQMHLNLCHSNHAAHRAIELEALVFWWDRMFKL